MVLPPLDGFRTEVADAGELRSSLDHAGVPYRDVRRFVVLDNQEFIAGEITVVTLEPGSAGGERYLRHRYGEARRVPVTIAGIRMLRIAATPHDAIAWSEDGLVFTFERGQEQTHEWLERVAAATVRVRVPAASQSALAGAGVTRYASNDLAVLRSPQEMAHVALGEFLAALAL